jgi:hypothetical protein
VVSGVTIVSIRGQTGRLVIKSSSRLFRGNSRLGGGRARPVYRLMRLPRAQQMYVVCLQPTFRSVVSISFSKRI